MEKSVEDLLNVGLRKLCDGKSGLGWLIMELALAGEGLTEEEARFLSRQAMSTWAQWHKDRFRELIEKG